MKWIKDNWSLALVGLVFIPLGLWYWSSAEASVWGSIMIKDMTIGDLLFIVIIHAVLSKD